MSDLSAQGLVVIVLFVLVMYSTLEIRCRRNLKISMQQNRGLYSMYVYTDTLTPGIFDELLGTWAESSKVGLFKENRDISLVIFGYRAEIVRETRFRTNNCGLLSPRNYTVARGTNEYRIVVLGDEQTAGTTADICWPDLLEDELNADRELVDEVGGLKFKVFNLGWPDAGLVHQAEVATVNARHFDPDLVVVNITAHAYSRYRQGLPSTLHGKPYHGMPIAYRAGEEPKDLAWLLALCTCEPATLRSLQCTAFPPFNFYMSPELIRSREKVWQIMQQVVSDFVDGVVLHDWRPFYMLQKLNKNFDPWAKRRIETPQPSIMGDQEIVDNAITQLKKIASVHRNVIFARNVTGHPDLFPTPTEDSITSRVRGAVPDLKIVMMRDRIVRGESLEELRSWYLPDDLSKWSPNGHAIYAKAMARLVEERLREGSGKTKARELAAKADVF